MSDLDPDFCGNEKTLRSGTERLYDQDPFLKEFDACVLCCEASGDGFQVILDRTAFYPEGGGQPADFGFLNDSAVTDVQTGNDSKIIHICTQPLQIGAHVHGRIDWERRFDHMQQHSGEHILSGILCADCHCDNVGFHLGAQVVTIDYNAAITREQALAAERKANAVIRADREVMIAYPSADERAAMTYRSKKELSGQVRIVTFPEADCCACCGTHVARAGQVGAVKVLTCQKFRTGTRLEILCGQRALDYLSAVYEESRMTGQRLSVRPEATLAAVERLEEELAAAKSRADSLEEAFFEVLAREQTGKGDVILFQPSMRPDSVRRLADAVARRCGALAAVFSLHAPGTDLYALVRADGGPVPIREMNAALHGRGGGKGGFAQGSVRANRSAIEAFFSETKTAKQS